MIWPMKSALHYPVGPSWRVLLADLGLEPSDVLRRADLAEGLLSRPGERLSPDEFYRFWEAMESLSTGHFALRFNESLRTDAFSPPVFAAMCSPNLLGAIRRLSEYKPLVAPMTIAITETPELVTFEPRWFGASRPVPSSMALGDLLFILRLARAGTRKPVTACRVWSESASEADQELASHFGTELETRVGHGIVLSRSEALRPFLTADPAAEVHHRVVRGVDRDVLGVGSGAL
ncbi:MAG: AraC family transcriptional regulator ligand-binding domain-containing protein, partial [Myxococcota bacterium]